MPVFKFHPAGQSLPSRFRAITIVALLGGFRAAIAADYPVVPVPFNRVEISDSFWQPRLKAQRETLVPHALDEAQVGVDDLLGAAGYLAGKGVPKGFTAERFLTSDLFKVMEGAAYLLQSQSDPALESRMDGLIEIIAAAQEPDGYIYPAHTTKVGTSADMTGDRPYSFVVQSHELYDMGHMYEAAVAYYQATGKDQLLKIAEKNAESVNRAFFEGDPRYNGGKPVMQAPGHPEIELALVKLYRATGKTLYLDMARRFLEIRGVTYRPEGEGFMAPAYAQQQAPVKEQREAVGHAVRAVYLYSGMADVSALTGDTSYQPALDSIWHDIVDTKMHITGGLGAVTGIEGFGPSYVLPNEDTYDETCAGVANVLFNYRMFLLKGDAKYLDVAEVALLNNVLAGVNLQGNCFFYVNPLETDGRRSFNQGSPSRMPWFSCACCPSNLARLLPQVPGMLYAHHGRDLLLTLYAGSQTRVPLDGLTVGINQQTNYPDDGHIALLLNPDRPAHFRLLLRIPTWTHEQFIPGKLYRYADGAESGFTLRVNGQPIHAAMEHGFAVINRDWQRGDRVDLDLPMPLHASTARPEVAADTDRVAFTRGPYVLCAEGVDNAGAVQRLFIDHLPAPDKVAISRTELAEHSSFLRVTFPADAITEDNRTRNLDATLVPYYAWNNRGIASMSVWFPLKRDLAVFNPLALPKGSVFHELYASSYYQSNAPRNLIDGRTPANSADTTIPHWESFPKKGEPQWIEGTFDGPRRIRSLGIYWYVDGEDHLLPEAWSVEVRQNGQWLPLHLYVTDAYGLRKDQFNVVHPDGPTTCDAIRINLKQAPESYFVGIQKLMVEFEK